MRRDARGTPLPSRPATCFFFFYSANSRLHSLNSGQFGPYQAKPADSETANSGRNSKKKKKRCKTHCLSLITYHTSAVQLTSSKHQALWLSLTPSLISHSLCALASLPLSLLFVSPVAMRHSAKQPLSHSKHQSSALFQSCGLCLIYEYHVLVIIYYCS